MTLALVPYESNPYDRAVKNNLSWVSEYTEKMNDIINVTSALIHKEALYDGQPELADENFLYERFKINCQYDMWFGNWRILKYFVEFFKLKIFKDMIGQWTFTENDREMYDYFNSVEVTDANKCKPLLIHFNTGKDPYDMNNKNTFYMLGASYRRMNEGLHFGKPCEPWGACIDQHYYASFGSLYDMIRNVKKLGKQHSTYDFFSSYNNMHYKTYYFYWNQCV